jgi:hypothetical protein
MVFRRLEQCLRVTGTARVNAGRPRTVRTPAKDDAIIVVVGKHRVLELLHDDELPPHHYLRSVCLFPDHHPLRMLLVFCEWLWHQHTADELFLYKRLWTDDACFTRVGVQSPLGTG